MIKVGFVGAVSKEWMGGLNYFKNLLFAIKKLNNKDKLAATTEQTICNFIMQNKNKNTN